MSSAYAKYPARYLFVPRSTARINTGRGCPLLPVIFVSPRYAAVRCIAAGVQYMYCQPCWILAETMQYIAVGEVMYVCQMCSILPPVCSICIVSRAGYWRRQCNELLSARFMCFCQLCSILPPVCSICIVSRAGYWWRQCNISLSARLYTSANYAVYSPVVQYICRQPCWILAVTMQYIAVGEVMYVCQLCSISAAGRAGYLLLAVPDIADDYAIYRCRRGG